MDLTLLKKPSAFVPLALSAAALSLIAGYAAFVGVPGTESTHDEGTAARLFQLLLAAQVPFIAYFAFKWLPQAPVKGVSVLVMQVAGIVAALGTIITLER